MNTRLLFCALSALVLLGCSADVPLNDSDPTKNGNSAIEKARVLESHGLTSEAKAVLIDVVFGNSDEASKAKAYYMLGGIAFEERRLAVAIQDWHDLSEKFPKSDEARTVEQRLRELTELVGDVKRESVDNVVAQSYLRHGDFWSKDKSNVLTIDSSWISEVDAATKWYDRVIEEFPGSSASRIAYEEKLKTLLGWEGPGRYGEKYGVQGSFSKYMPQLLETFGAFEKAHPEARMLQAFRYQIAQVYWSNKKWVETKEWLNIVIQKSGEEDSFYSDLANRRLKKVEW